MEEKLILGFCKSIRKEINASLAENSSGIWNCQLFVMVSGLLQSCSQFFPLAQRWLSCLCRGVYQWDSCHSLSTAVGDLKTGVTVKPSEMRMFSQRIVEYLELEGTRQGSWSPTPMENWPEMVGRFHGYFCDTCSFPEREVRIKLFFDVVFSFYCV